jgi:hypothetical protein
MDQLGIENTHDDEDVVQTRPSSANVSGTNVSTAINQDTALATENNNDTQLAPPPLPQNRNRRSSTVRIRCLPLATSVLQQTADNTCDKNTDNPSDGRQQGHQQATGRGRSISEPHRLQWTLPTSDLRAQDSRFPQIEEGKQSQPVPPPPTPAQHYGSDSFLRRASLAAGSALRLRKTSTVSAPPMTNVEYDSDDVNLLDVVGGHFLRKSFQSYPY